MAAKRIPRRIVGWILRPQGIVCFDRRIAGRFFDINFPIVDTFPHRVAQNLQTRLQIIVNNAALLIGGIVFAGLRRFYGHGDRDLGDTSSISAILPHRIQIERFPAVSFKPLSLVQAALWR